MPSSPSGDVQRGIDSRALSSRRLSTIVRSNGTGATLFDGAAITPFEHRSYAWGEGVLFFLRDLDSAATWSSSAWLSDPPTDFEWTPGSIRLRWSWQDLDIVLHVVLDVERPIEYHLLTLRDRTGHRRRLQLSTYLEPVLHDPIAHASHPEFSKLFVRTEWLRDRGALLAQRRPRDPTQEHPVAAHVLLGSGAEEWETDRSRFVGRGCGRWPRALRAPLSGTTGDVLDPILSLRCELEVESRGTWSGGCALVAASDRASALGILDKLDTSIDPQRLRDSARTEAEAALERLELSVPQAERLQELAARILQRDPTLRAEADIIRRAHGDRDALSRFGWLPHRSLALVHVGEEDDPRREEARRAQSYWRSLGLPIDLLLLCGAESLEQLESASRELPEIATASLSPQEIDLLHTVAQMVVMGEWPEPGGVTPVARTATEASGMARVVARRTNTSTTMWSNGSPSADRLPGFNGIGAFSEDGREYVMRIAVGENGAELPPRPWTNVIGHESFGFLISETAAGSTWSLNSRERRLTPWFNDPLVDPHGEALFLRDDATGETWSPMPGPTPGVGVHAVRHGFGYSRFSVHHHDLHQDCLVFASRERPVKITSIRLRNDSSTARRVSVYAYQQLVLGTGLDHSSGWIETDVGGTQDALLARNAVDSTGGVRCAFAAAVATQNAFHRTVTTDRASFLGAAGDVTRPEGLESEFLDGRVGVGLDPCFAQQLIVDLSPGETAQVDFLFGEESSRDAAERCVERLTKSGAIDASWGEMTAFWEELLSRVEISTPVAALDRMVNGWLPYQVLSCRLWGRTALYQSGGAFGFRDQLQDVAALLLQWPECTRHQILLHCAHQFVEGDVLHWWHPPNSVGIRTRFVDDLLWLPFVVAEYLQATGDRSVLDEDVGFVESDPLPDGVDELYLRPRCSEDSATVYEHCCRAIDRSLEIGQHGLPLFGSGDWNDGMNRVGGDGRGESVWMAQFLYWILGRFASLCQERTDADRAARYVEHRASLRRAIEDAWDGDWYRRGYYDDGEPLGSRRSDDCQIDALTQAWAVISESASLERGEWALRAVEERLIDERNGIIRLLDPPFDEGSHDPGYIKGYVPGVRENGGQYTHAALWVVKALAQLRRHDRVAALLEMLTPIRHTRTPEALRRYGLEPYVVAADVYGVPPHVGRGGWSWYTGSAGWMYRVALESLLGVQMENGDALRLQPCIPHEWPEFRVRLRLFGGSTTYEILATNASGSAARLHSASLDGVELEVDETSCRVPLVADGGLHRVALRFAAAEGRASP